MRSALTLAKHEKVCRTTLLWHTRICYSLESRVKDIHDFLGIDKSLNNRVAFAEGTLKYQRVRKKFHTLASNSMLPDALEILHFWTPEERHIFFSVRRCLNEFDAPIYENFTEELLTDIIVHTRKYSEYLEEKGTSLLIVNVYPQENVKGVSLMSTRSRSVLLRSLLSSTLHGGVGHALVNCWMLSTTYVRQGMQNY